MIFHVTEQTASVVNRIYAIEADTAEEAQEALEYLSGEDKDEALFDQETVQMNCEVIGADPAPNDNK